MIQPNERVVLDKVRQVIYTYSFKVARSAQASKIGKCTYLIGNDEFMKG